jgi:hypothetical protein
MNCRCIATLTETQTVDSGNVRSRDSSHPTQRRVSGTAGSRVYKVGILANVGGGIDSFSSPPQDQLPRSSTDMISPSVLLFHRLRGFRNPGSGCIFGVSSKMTPPSTDITRKVKAERIQGLRRHGGRCATLSSGWSPMLKTVGWARCSKARQPTTLSQDGYSIFGDRCCAVLYTQGIHLGATPVLCGAEGAVPRQK